jgi:hypothetical protein
MNRGRAAAVCVASLMIAAVVLLSATMALAEHSHDDEAAGANCADHSHDHHHHHHHHHHHNADVKDWEEEGPLQSVCHSHHDHDDDDEDEGGASMATFQEPWVARWSSSVDGSTQEEPLVFTSSDGRISYLTWFNYHHFLRHKLLPSNSSLASTETVPHCRALLIFWYHQGCTLCEEVYSTSFVALAKEGVADLDGHSAVCFAQYDATSTEEDPSILQTQGPRRRSTFINGRNETDTTTATATKAVTVTTIDDFPTVTWLTRSTLDGRLIDIEGFQGALSAEGVRRMLAAEHRSDQKGVPPTDHADDKYQQDVAFFDNGILVV